MIFAVLYNQIGLVLKESVDWYSLSIWQKPITRVTTDLHQQIHGMVIEVSFIDPILLSMGLLGLLFPAQTL